MAHELVLREEALNLSRLVLGEASEYRAPREGASEHGGERVRAMAVDGDERWLVEQH